MTAWPTPTCYEDAEAAYQALARHLAADEAGLRLLTALDQAERERRAQMVEDHAARLWEAETAACCPGCRKARKRKVESVDESGELELVA